MAFSPEVACLLHLGIEEFYILGDSIWESVGCSPVSCGDDTGLCGTFFCWMSGGTRPLRKIVLGTGSPGGLSEDKEESGMEILHRAWGLRKANSGHPVSAVLHVERRE